MVLGFAQRAWYTPAHLILAVAGAAAATRGGAALRAAWVAAGAASSVFTLLSVEMGDDTRLVRPHPPAPARTLHPCLHHHPSAPAPAPAPSARARVPRTGPDARRGERRSSLAEVFC